MRKASKVDPLDQRTAAQQILARNLYLFDPARLACATMEVNTVHELYRASYTVRTIPCVY